MTQEEAQEIIKNAKPIVIPSSSTTVDIKNSKTITSFKSFFSNGNNKERRTKMSEGQSKVD